jgi:UPF0755 protein
MPKEIFPEEIYPQKAPISKRRLTFWTGFVSALIIVIIYIVFFSAPKDFPRGYIYDLKAGQTLTGVADDFSKSHIIKSQFIFKTLVFLIEGNGRVFEGDYVMSERQNVFKLAWRIANGITELSPVKITLPEGLNSNEIANILSTNLQTFDKNNFLKYATKYEGYLFPDTYLITPGTKENKVVDIMVANFDDKIKSLDDKIKAFGKSESDVVKMASILEEEARTTESKRIVAGILWKRISIGMPLQVDSSFKYINGKTTKTLSVDDLKIDSPYNSYAHKGLPPTAISNPGLSSIEATITPIKSSYLYFLTGSDGNMYYAKTFAEHVANKEKYLR